MGDHIIAHCGGSFSNRPTYFHAAQRGRAQLSLFNLKGIKAQEMHICGTSPNNSALEQPCAKP
jgi:hypothetical protein